MLKVAGDHSLFLVILVFFLFTHWYYMYYYRIVSFVVGVFPCHSLLSAVTLFGLMEVEMEMQLSSHMDAGVTASPWFIVWEIFFTARSCTWEDIN